MNGSLMATGTRFRTGDRALALAIVGAPLIGRSNPLRSVFGYALATSSPALADGIRVFPALATRDEFGDGSPDLGPLWRGSFGTSIKLRAEPMTDLAARLAKLDAVRPLKPGDVIMCDLASAPRPRKAPTLVRVSH
jgi:hypothetical protein